MNPTAMAPLSCQHHTTCSFVSPKSESSCPHIHTLKNSAIFAGLPTVHQFLLFSKLSLPSSAQFPIPTCNKCSTTLGRLGVCIHCVYFGCWKGKHMQDHFKETDHTFAIDITSLNLFCSECNDIVYDTDYDFITCIQTFRLDVFKRTHFKSEEKLQALTPWLPSIIEKNIIDHHSTPYSVSSHVIGLRGLLNLGNTCFMNSILQCFLANPLMQNYFLSDIHNRFTCTRRKRANSVCLTCEIEYLYEEAFTGISLPYNPAPLLYSVWKLSDYFAGYEQQDAHEFFISTLNSVHSHCTEVSEGDVCQCIIHQVFGGVLRSDLTCSQCGYRSSAYEPIFDISVNVSKEKTTSLGDCLSKFTQPETLQSGEKHQCSNCQRYQESMKRLSIDTLPAVLCIHLKRFEQSYNNPKKSSIKIDSFVQFPLELNMEPFTCASIYNENSDELPNPKDYQLFAIVHHFGNMENGHYISYIRHPRSMWVKCDDAFITQTSLESILNVQAYLLFYIRKT